MAIARRLVVGNWKMNLTPDAAADLTHAVCRALVAEPAAADVALCPPHALLGAVAGPLADSPVAALGGQDCHAADAGAHTGDVSAAMLGAMGCRYVIVGHSERRAAYGETDEQVRAKAEAGLRAGLTPIICVGESEAERDGGDAEAVVAAMTAASVPDAGAVVVAYEPVWAIGSGRTPTHGEIAAVVQQIRAALGPRGAETLVLYGGSVKGAGARGLFAETAVDGALVGGASLKAEAFLPIIRAA